MNKTISAKIAILVIFTAASAAGTAIFCYSKNINSVFNNQYYQDLFLSKGVIMNEEYDLSKIKEEDFLIADLVREIRLAARNKCDMGRLLLKTDDDIEEYGGKGWYSVVPWIEESGDVKLINGYYLSAENRVYHYPEKERCFIEIITNYLLDNDFILNKENTVEEWSVYGLEKGSVRVLISGYYLDLYLGNSEDETDLGEITIDDYNKIYTLANNESGPVIRVIVTSIVDDFATTVSRGQPGSGASIYKKINGEWKYLTDLLFPECEIVIKENIPPIIIDFHCWHKNEETSSEYMKYNEENNSWESIMEDLIKKQNFLLLKG